MLHGQCCIRCGHWTCARHSIWSYLYPIQCTLYIVLSLHGHSPYVISGQIFEMNSQLWGRMKNKEHKVKTELSRVCQYYCEEGQRKSPATTSSDNRDIVILQSSSVDLTQLWECWHCSFLALLSKTSWPAQSTHCPTSCTKISHPSAGSLASLCTAAVMRRPHHRHYNTTVLQSGGQL